MSKIIGGLKSENVITTTIVTTSSDPVEFEEIEMKGVDTTSNLNSSSLVFTGTGSTSVTVKNITASNSLTLTDGNEREGFLLTCDTSGTGQWTSLNQTAPLREDLNSLPDLVGYYKFISDLTGTSSDLSVTGSPVTNVEQVTDSNGVSRYNVIQMANESGVTTSYLSAPASIVSALTSQDFTISLSFRITGPESNQTILSLDNGVTNPNNIVVRADTAIKLTFGGSNSSATTFPNDGLWHTLSLMVSTNRYYLLYDGDTVIDTVASPSQLSSLNAVTLGSLVSTSPPAGTFNGFTGEMTDISFTTGVLSLNQQVYIASELGPFIQRATVNQITTDGITIRGDNTTTKSGDIRFFNSSTNEDITDLLPATAEGILFEGTPSGHAVVGIRGDSSTDSFSVIHSSSYTTDQDYSNGVNRFTVDGTGSYTVGGVHMQVTGNLSASGFSGWRIQNEGGTGTDPENLIFRRFNDGDSGTRVGFVEDDTTTNFRMNDFTGQHGTCGVDGMTPNIGYIVSSTGKYCNSVVSDNNATLVYGKEAITINDALPIVEYSSVSNDRRVFGVLSDKEEDNTSRKYQIGVFGTYWPKVQGDNRFVVNSLGEGAIWVSDIGGTLVNGDYITSSTLPGLGAKQTDDLLHNYTVAKITMDCDFTGGDPDNHTDYQIKWVDTSGDDITYTEYQTSGGHICAFVGCTYHCG